MRVVRYSIVDYASVELVMDDAIPEVKGFLFHG